MAKSIIEEALLEAEKLQESLKKNTKEILAATMRQEIDDIVKESFLTEEGEEVDVTDVETDELENANDSEDNSEEETSDETETDSEETDEVETDSEETEDDSSEYASDQTNMGDYGVDNVSDTSAQEIDMTDEPISNVISVYKKMSDNDEIEVVQDGQNIDLKDNTTGAEYKLRLGESSKSMMNKEENIYEISLDSSDSDLTEEGMCNECGSGGMYEESDDNNVYEISLDEDLLDIDDVKNAESYLSSKEADIEENKQHIKRNRYSTFGNNMKTGGRMEESYLNKINHLVKENKSLKKLVNEFESKQGEYKSALKIFRDKLNEIALFNTNLTYATKLFTEHSTTKQEKANILKRFDSVVDLKESKNLYKTISDELGVRAPINESIDKKVNKTVSKGSMIKESTVYVDPQIKNIQSLMEKLDGRV